MKLTFTLLAFCGLLSFQSFGQTFTWDTNDTIETNLALNTTVLLPMHQSAIGTDTVTLAIEIIYNDIPATWDGMVCIYGSCLGTIPPVGTQATMTPISGIDQGMVRLTVNPMNGTETAKLQIYVYDEDFPNDGDTATWLLNTTLSVDDEVWDDLSLYPNPVNDIMVVNTSNMIDVIEVYSINGSLVTRFERSNTNKVDLSSLDTGSYMLKLIQPDGTFALRKIQKM